MMGSVTREAGGAVEQVCPLTQFFLFPFHNQGSVCNCAFSTNAQSRFASVVVDGRGESRAHEGRHVSSKSPSRVRDGEEGVAGRNRRE